MPEKHNLTNIKNEKEGITRDGTDTKNIIRKDFPSAPVVKNPPANAGDTGSIPGPGNSLMLQSDMPCATTTEAHTLYNPGSATREATTMKSLKPRVAPTLCN